MSRKSERIQQMIDIIDQHESNIQAHGFSIAIQPHCHTHNPGPTIIYTIGLTLHGLPEIILFGINPNHVAGAINGYFQEIQDGSRPVEKRGPGLYDEFFNLPLQIITCTNTPMVLDRYAELTDAWARAHGVLDQVRFEQWVWTDTKARFPWHDDFDPSMFDFQPILGEAPEA